MSVAMLVLVTGVVHCIQDRISASEDQSDLSVGVCHKRLCKHFNVLLIGAAQIRKILLQNKISGVTAWGVSYCNSGCCVTTTILALTLSAQEDTTLLSSPHRWADNIRLQSKPTFNSKYVFLYFNRSQVRGKFRIMFQTKTAAMS